MNSTNNSFQKLYRELNAQQKQAVNTIDGPVMVVAGPGTGKTRVLTLRIANILLKSEARPSTMRHPAKPEEILALTFTESGAAAMRSRLLEILGTPAYYICLHTFHAFCNEIIKDNPEEFAQFFEKDVVEDISRLQILEKVIEAGPFKALKPFADPFMYAPHMLRAFSELKKEGVGPEAFKTIVQEEESQLQGVDDLYYESGPHKGKMKGKYKDFERNVEKNKELVLAYGVYQKKLLDAGYDYDDMILSVLGKLESDKNFLQKLQEKYKYILVDEHQDTNQAQNRVLDLLCSYEKAPRLRPHFAGLHGVQQGFGGQANIFVVGDEKQSIYRFQGANLANFLYFHSKFPDAKIITLKENYRSTQSILDAADSVIANNSQKLSDVLPGVEQSLLSKNGNFAEEINPVRSREGLPPRTKQDSERVRGFVRDLQRSTSNGVNVHSFDSKEPEHYFLASEIQALIKTGAAPEEIAILYRDNKDAFPIKEMFQKFEIPTRVESDEQILQNEDIANLMLILRAVSNFGDDELLAKALHINFLNIPPLDVYKLFDASKFASRASGRVSLYDLIRSKRRMRKVGISRATRINKLYYRLSSWSEFAANKSAPQTFEKIVNESGFLEHMLQRDDYIESVAKARMLLHLSRRLASSGTDYNLSDFLKHLDLIRVRGISLKSKSLGINQSAVRLMTAHRAKGLEFDYVFITGVHDGHWGRRRTRELLKLPSAVYRTAAAVTKDDSARRGQGRAQLDDDERRLFYVALTRARKKIYITYATKKEDEKEVLPSQFVEEIKDKYKKRNNGSRYSRQYYEDPIFVFKAGKDIRIKDDEFEFLRGLFDQHGLSATALNNYIECPWKYFYVNLLRIPKAKAKHQMYGTAIHAALRDLFDFNPAGSDPAGLGRTPIESDSTPVNYLLTRFERALLREPISEFDFKESLEKGKETLTKYYKNYKNTWHTNTVNEFSIKNVFLDGEVRLTGKIDKIELLSGTVPAKKQGLSLLCQEVNVVDYKTGKRKTRNDLEGKTKNATGNEKRQLVFYKLLLDNLPVSAKASSFAPPSLLRSEELRKDTAPEATEGHRKASEDKSAGKPDYSYKMVSGEIDFVEPDKNTGKFYKEKFDISDDDIRELEYKIQDVTTEIRGFSFWDKRCEAGYRMVPYRMVRGNDKKCEYCQLREGMVLGKR